MAVDQTISEQVVVNVAAGSQTLSLMPVLALTFRMTPASVKYLADKAKSAGRLLTIMNVIVPIALIVIGVGLAVVAVIRRHKPMSASDPSAAGTDRSQRATPMDTALPR